jgi:hypothetical protein
MHHSWTEAEVQNQRTSLVEAGGQDYLTDRGANALLFTERIKRREGRQWPDQCGSRILRRRKSMTRLTSL